MHTNLHFESWFHPHIGQSIRRKNSRSPSPSDAVRMGWRRLYTYTSGVMMRRKWEERDWRGGDRGRWETPHPLSFSTIDYSRFSSLLSFIGNLAEWAEFLFVYHSPWVRESESSKLYGEIRNTCVCTWNALSFKLYFLALANCPKVHSSSKRTLKYRLWFLMCVSRCAVQVFIHSVFAY